MPKEILREVNLVENSKSIIKNTNELIGSFPEIWKKYCEEREDIIIKGPNPTEWEY